MSRSGTWLVLVATVGLALKGIWARLAYATGLDVPAVLFYRNALAAPLFAVGALWLLRRERSWLSQAPPRPLVRHWLAAASLGAGFSLAMLADFQAIHELGAGVSRLILFGFPLVVLLLEAAEARRLPPRPSLVGFCLAWLGLVLVASPSWSGEASASGAGLLWALSALLLYAGYVFFTGKLARRLGSARLAGVSNLSTAAVVLAAVLVQGSGSAPATSASGLFWVMVMVMVSTVVPFFLMTEGIRRLGSGRASLLAMSGPVITLLASYLVLGETLSLLQILGTVATLVGVSVATGTLPLRAVRNPASAAAGCPQRS